MSSVNGIAHDKLARLIGPPNVRRSSMCERMTTFQLILGLSPALLEGASRRAAPR